jgi:hypothetical protein
VRIAEKITNDVLPLYGDGLVGEFDDIRPTDRQLELAEIEAYARTHTVDEVRAKYYNDQPLDMGRGVLLVTEVTHGITPAGQQQEAGPAKRDILGYHIESGVVTRNEARADVGLGPVDDSQDMRLRDLRAKLEVMKAATDAGIPTEQAAALVGVMCNQVDRRDAVAIGEQETIAKTLVNSVVHADVTRASSAKAVDAYELRSVDQVQVHVQQLELHQIGCRDRL